MSDVFWSWLHGTNGIGELGVYLTDPGTSWGQNTPGARGDACCWEGPDGRIYLFGGNGLGGQITAQGRLNDLWCFDPSDNAWLFIKGSTTINQVGMYGTRNIPAATNVPGARDQACCWMGMDGYFYLFGGLGMDSTGFSGNLNDLWCLNLSDYSWTWIKGATLANQSGIYGTQGVARSDLTPGARDDACSWEGPDGHLYLFGGVGRDSVGNSNNLNDLWRFNLSDQNWTWLKGANITSQVGVYGVQGTPRSDLTPGAREQACCWVGVDDHLYLFGGFGRSATSTNGSLNDLWRFNLSDKNWTWLKGSDGINQNGIYGTIGVESSTNLPGGRVNACCWVGSDGQLYLFGGSGFASSGSNILNDLWRYSRTTNNWTWLKGSNTTTTTATYGALGISASSNVPGGRQTACCWKGGNGQLYVLGGVLSTNTGVNPINDLWCFNLADTNWTWVKGATAINQMGIYGRPITTANTMPGAREQVCCMEGPDGHLYLFAGGGFDATTGAAALNDLWRFNVSNKTWTWVRGWNIRSQPGGLWYPRCG